MLVRAMNAGVDPDCRVTVVDITGLRRSQPGPAGLIASLRSLIGKPLPTADLGRIAQVLPRHVRHIVFSGAPIFQRDRSSRNRSVANLPDLLEQSVLIESGPNIKPGAKPGVDSYHRFYVPVWDGSAIRILRIVAEQTKTGIAINPSEFDIYDVVIEGGSSPSGAKQGVNPASISQQKGQRPTSLTIRQMLTGVKGMDGQVYFQGEEPGISREIAAAIGRQAYVQLEPSEEGDFYDVKTATPSRKDQFRNKKPLWERAGPSQSADQTATVNPSVQSGEDGLPQKGVLSQGGRAATGSSPRGTYAPDTDVITLFRPANPSTVIHEMGADDVVVEGKRLPPNRSVPPGTTGTTPLQVRGQPLDITIRQMLTGVKGMDGQVYFQGETPRGIAWAALAGDVNSFTTEVRRVVTQGASNNRTVRVGEVPLLLNRLGLSRREQRIRETDIIKIISGKHAGTVTEEQLGRAVALLADPVFVLKSGTIDGALVAVLDDVDSKGDFLVVAIHPAQGTVTFHGLKSLYGKEKTPADSTHTGAQKWLETAIKPGDVLYMNSKKASGLSRAARVNIPAVSKVRSQNPKVRSERDLVKGRRANPEFYQTDQTGDGPLFAQGPFGPVFTEFKGNAQGAVAKLMETKNGEAVGALHHPEIGEIDLVWGKEGTSHSDGFGLAKLAKYHPEVLGDLQGILSTMAVVSRSPNRINLESPDHRAGVRLTWDGHTKQWLMTAFRKKTGGGDATTTDIDALSGTDDTASRADTSDHTVDQTLRDFYQSKAASPRGSYVPDTDVITLFRSAHPSTVIHDMGADDAVVEGKMLSPQQEWAARHSRSDAPWYRVDHAGGGGEQRCGGW